MTTTQKTLIGGSVALVAAALLVSVPSEPQSVKVAWDVPAGATVTGLEQSDTMPPTWRQVAEFPVAENGGAFTAQCAVINGQGYWRAWTR